MSSRPHSIHPSGCRCTDDMTGDSITLDEASERHISALLRGQIHNSTGQSVEVTYTFEVGSDDTLRGAPDRVEARIGDRTWDLDPYALPAVAQPQPQPQEQ